MCSLELPACRLIIRRLLRRPRRLIRQTTTTRPPAPQQQHSRKKLSNSCVCVCRCACILAGQDPSMRIVAGDLPSYIRSSQQCFFSLPLDCGIRRSLLACLAAAVRSVHPIQLDLSLSLAFCRNYTAGLQSTALEQKSEGGRCGEYSFILIECACYFINIYYCCCCNKKKLVKILIPRITIIRGWRLRGK